MAKPKKKAATSKSDAGQVLSRLRTNMKRLQREAEGLLGRTRKQATQLISRDQRRALDRLLSQAKKLRTDLEERAERASKDVESRAERLVATIEKEMAKRLAPLLKRLDLPSRKEVEALSRRISQLERALRSSRPTPALAGPIERPPEAVPSPAPVPSAEG